MDKLLQKIPQKSRESFIKITELTDSFCDRYLNEEYLQLCREMAAVLCRSRSLTMGGKPESWAAGIVSALGAVNCLFDKESKPHMSTAEIADGFNISTGTMAGKSKIIKDKLDLIPLDPNWCLPSLLDDNPLVWMVDINGFICDARQMPSEIQQKLYEAGRIPYVPEPKETKDDNLPPRSNKPERKAAAKKVAKKRDINQGDMFE